MKISQAEARRLRKRVAELSEQLAAQKRSWLHEWPGGIHLGTITMGERDFLVGRIEAARKLGHAAVLVSTDTKNLHVYACKL